MTKTLAPRRCGLFLPGHEVHYIQALHAANDRDNRPVAGSLLSVDDNGELAVEVDGQVQRLWNHEPVRLRAIAAASHNRIEVHQRWGTLRIPHPDGVYLFYLADLDDHRPCPPTPLTGTPAELAVSAGGFSLSSAQLQAWADGATHPRHRYAIPPRTRPQTR